MNRALIITACCFLFGCGHQKQDSSPITHLLTQNGYWKMAGGDAFLDGGSVCLTFISGSGEALHLFVLADNFRENGKLKVEFRRNYNDKNPVVILEGSQLEKRAIWLLDNYHDRPEIQSPKTEIAQIRQAILNRKGEFPFIPPPIPRGKTEPDEPANANPRNAGSHR